MSCFRRRLRTIIGLVAIALFVALYAGEFLPRHGPPVTIRWVEQAFGRGGLIALNIFVVLAFLALLPYRRPSKSTWKTHGTFIAFVIALMTEMFGWPLLIFLVSPVADIPSLAPWMHRHFGHRAATTGTLISFAGIALIAVGWFQIHRADAMVTGGLYRLIRHPQYTGIFLFTAGWILHWPSVITLFIWPILIGAYVWLARQEEKAALREFGEPYRAYMKRTRMFIPYIV
jgi:protein-S-isoprenylcysteine O-methyltransferase Ste14